jgi:Putative adhesin
MNRWRGALVVTGGIAVRCAIRDTETHTYELTGAITRLVVDDSAGHVEITVGDGPVRVTETMRYGRQRPTTTHTNVGGTVHLTAASCWAIFDRGCEVDYTVRVPARTAVQIQANAGSVRVTGLTGDLRVTADAGVVRATELGSAHTTVQADAGQVSLRYRAVPSTVDAHTDAGSVEIWVPGGTPYAVEASTDAGERTIGVPTDSASPHRITAHAGAGSVRIHSA